jgi:hypothetical protein
MEEQTFAPGINPEDPPVPDEGSGVKREEPEISESRRKLVAQWTTEIKADKEHWKKAFEQIRDDQDFARGRQWSKSWEDERYVANITLRHVQQRVAALYARNPRAVAKRRTRMMNTVWDGTLSGVMMAMQQLQQASMVPGMPVDPTVVQGPLAILQEAKQAVEYKAMTDKFSRTLELLYDYNLDEQAHSFKAMMKLVVRRAVTGGVGYVKLGFQRVMQARPDNTTGIPDITAQLASIQRISSDVADGTLPKDNPPELEQLRLQLQSVSQQQEAVVREGLLLDYPESTAILPDRKTRQLKEFLGSDHVTQEYMLSPAEIQEIYGIDVSTRAYRAYREGTTTDPGSSPVLADQGIWPENANTSDEDRLTRLGKDICLVWECYDRKSGLVYVICDGYPDFLQEPAAPDVWTENFYPWFPLVLNECDHPSRIFPPSDVFLIRHQQMEYNRLREGLREHRIANRPATVAGGGLLSEKDRDTMLNRPANALIELDGLQPGQSVDQLLQPFRPPGVDPNLYEVNGVFEDVLRTVGTQEANMGGLSGGTATESSIAESSRMSSLASNVDDLDDLLTRLARNAGQILMAEVSEETVKEVIGPGAVWPEMSRMDLAKEIHLEIEAGSAGRPNQAQEVQNFERLAPLLMQIPGISPELMAKEGIRRLDDKLELEDLYDPNQLSIMAMNQLAGRGGPGGPGGPGAGTGPGSDPAAQGSQGASNAPQPSGGPAGASTQGTNVGPPPGMVPM